MTKPGSPLGEGVIRMLESRKVGLGLADHRMLCPCAELPGYPALGRHARRWARCSMCVGEVDSRALDDLMLESDRVVGCTLAAG